jgi:hypothetical protein
VRGEATGIRISRKANKTVFTLDSYLYFTSGAAPYPEKIYFKKITETK